MSYPNNLLTAASWADRLSRQQGRMGTMFAVVTMVTLGLVAYNAWQDIVKRSEERER